MIAVILVSSLWTTTAINVIIIVWNMAATTKNPGRYTGLYHFVYYPGAVFAPGSVGTITDVTGRQPFMLNVPMFAVPAIVMFGFIKTKGMQTA